MPHELYTLLLYNIRFAHQNFEKNLYYEKNNKCLFSFYING